MSLASPNSPKPAILWIRYSLIIGFAPILAVVLGLDSLQLEAHGHTMQWLADLCAIAYFLIILQGLNAEERRIALIFVPFSALAEYLFSQVFELYIYRLGMVPLYVPFGHAILFSTGIVLSDLDVIKKWDPLRWILLSVHLVLFALAILLWHDWLSATLGLVFLWVIRRKGVRLLYVVMGCLVLIVEILGTSLGCWEWQVGTLHNLLHTTNPPVGAFVFYILGDLGGFKLGRWFDQWQLQLQSRALE